MLRVEAIDTFYGTSQALFGVTLQVLEGEVVCLLGRNGAGKSTLLQSIVGLLPPRQGRILFRQEDITGWPPHRICRCGIGFVPENRRLFGSLTVHENLEVGWRPGTDEPKSALYGRILELFPSLRGLLRRKAGTLSGGEQQMLAIARTLMGSPTCLLLDEPAEGLAPMVVEALQERLAALKQAGYTLLVAAQSLPFVTALADRAYVLATGRVQYSGSMADLLADEEVVQTYLSV
jgi:branched-chain amino acid transport system ATP-binding protein